MTWKDLREGHIVGVVDSYGAVHSQFTGEEMMYHEDLWPNIHTKWRWTFEQCVHATVQECKPSAEEYDSIMAHMEKKYGIKFWDNGYHDLDYFIAKLEKEREKNDV